MKRLLALLPIAILLFILGTIGCGGGGSGEISPTICEGDYTVNDSVDIAALSECNVISGGVVIEDTNLTSLTELENLITVDGDLNIGRNFALTNLTGLENLTTVGGHLMIHRNHALTSLTVLDNLTSVGGNLFIGFNSVLTSLTGLENLPSVGGHLIIHSNSVLTNLTGLENITSVGGNLHIDSNDVLTSLAVLNNVSSVGYLLLIEDNINLPTCEAERLRDEIGIGNIGGEITIENNTGTGTCP